MFFSSVERNNSKSTLDLNTQSLRKNKNLEAFIRDHLNSKQRSFVAGNNNIYGVN